MEKDSSPPDEKITIGVVFQAKEIQLIKSTPDSIAKVVEFHRNKYFKSINIK